MLKLVVIRCIGALYGYLGLLFLPTFIEYITKGFVQSVLFFLTLLSIIICFLIMYAFWTLKSWGRYLVIVYNGLWLGNYTVRLLQASIRAPALLFYIVVVIFFGTITFFCFRKEVKELMRN